MCIFTWAADCKLQYHAESCKFEVQQDSGGYFHVYTGLNNI